jgi:hypothetical protein
LDWTTRFFVEAAFFIGAGFFTGAGLIVFVTTIVPVDGLEEAVLTVGGVGFVVMPGVIADIIWMISAGDPSIVISVPLMVYDIFMTGYLLVGCLSC